MAQKVTLKQRWQYFFDNLMARGAPAMIGMLALASLAVIFASGLIVTAGGQIFAPDGTDGLSFSEALWMSLMRTMDAGTMGGDAGWGFRLVMFVLPTLGGVFIIGALIGVLSTAVDGKLGDLRKGRSLVLEQNHSVILGWSAQVFTIIAELVEANANQKRAAIVILADEDKVTMEDTIHARVPDLKTTRVICRSGSPIDPSDLALVNPHQARSIIVLPPEGENADNFVIKSVLALTNNPDRHAEPYNIVTQIHEAKNMQVVKMLGAQDTVNAVLVGDLIARVMAQTSRQSGLSLIYTDLLNFGGDEIYFKAEPLLSGKTYAEALMLYEDSAVLGLIAAGGTARLNPPMHTPIGAGDQVVLLSADDDTIRLSGRTDFALAQDALRAQQPLPPPRAERVLLLGWNRFAPTILRELDQYVPPASTVTVMADARFERGVHACTALQRQTLTFQAGNTTARDVLDGLEIAGYDHVIVLADTTLTVQEADARTLVTLLHLRDMAAQDETPFSIVSEMLDLRNRALAEVTKVDDFIVSNHLISLMMAQLSENAALMAVFRDLFDPSGAEIYLKPAAQYVAPGEPVNFYTVIEAARQRGETAFGYRIHAEEYDAQRSYGVHTNPLKSALITFTAADKIVVLAD